MKKIGFVVPWYHKDIRGGAEQELRGIVTHLKANFLHNAQSFLSINFDKYSLNIADILS